MDQFGIVSKRSNIHYAIGCDRCVLDIGAQHGKNVHHDRYQSVRVIPVSVPNSAVNIMGTDGERVLDIDARWIKQHEN